MSEGLKQSSNEVKRHRDNLESSGQIEKLRNQLEKSAEKESQNNHEKEATEARSKVEKLAISGKEQAPSGAENKQDSQTVHRSIKKQNYKTTMRRIESRLPSYQRQFSRVINNPSVDKVSAVAAKTVARPSGIIGAGSIAFFALLIISYYANRYGWQLSGSEFTIFVAIGWALGLLTEAILKLIKRF